MKLLQEMRASLDESRLSLQAAFENEKREAQELAAQYDKKIAQLQDVIIPGLLDDIETKEGCAAFHLIHA